MPAPLDRQLIIDNAMTQLSRGGILGLSFRGLGAVLNVAPEDLKHFFIDRPTFEAALAVESSQWLLNSLQRAISTIPVNAEIYSLAYAFMKFSVTEPHVFSLCQKYDGPHRRDAGEKTAVWAFILAKVGEISENIDVMPTAISLWAILSGFAACAAMECISESELTQSIDITVRGWTMGTVIRSAE